MTQRRPNEAERIELDLLCDSLERLIDGQHPGLPGREPSDPGLARLWSLLARLAGSLGEPCDLHQVLSRLDDTAKQRAAERGLQWKLEVSPGFPRKVRMRADGLPSLLEDLLAIGIGPTRGARLFSAQFTIEAGDPGRGWLRARLEAPGFLLGIPAGLHAAARHLGGVLDDDPQIGHRVDLLIEVALNPDTTDTPQDSLATYADHRQGLRGKRILAADDNEVNRLIIRAVLEDLGCQVFLVSSGEEAIRRVQEGGIDAGVFDVHMPGTDGAEAVRQIRAWEAHTGVRRTPILALTADTSTGNQHACREAGMDLFLTKPLDVDALRRGLSALTQESPAQSTQDTTSIPAAPTLSPSPTPLTSAPLVQAAAEPNLSPETLEQPTGADADDLLDFRQMDTMREIMGVRAFDDLIDTFLQYSAEQLDLLDNAIRNGDARSTRRIAHSLKSSAGQMGAVALSRVARWLEDMSRTGELSELGADVVKARVELGRVRVILRPT